eukprot:c44115_g1_i1 orf=139-351(+)
MKDLSLGHFLGTQLHALMNCSGHFSESSLLVCIGFELRDALHHLVDALLHLANANYARLNRLKQKLHLPA